MAFLPTEYSVPDNDGKYMKLMQGENLFRILSPALLGYQDWKTNLDGKKSPVRYPYTPEKRPKPIGDPKNLKHFWSFAVWNYKVNAVQVLTITQATIQNSLYGYINDDAWGNPTNYDFSIKREGEGMDTDYTVKAYPPKPLRPEIVSAWGNMDMDLNKLMTNGDPFISALEEIFEAKATDVQSVDYPEVTPSSTAQDINEGIPSDLPWEEPLPLDKK